MKAPNGKPSNLTPQQWKLVRTPQFKAWFGDFENDPENASKVVDENGEPRLVYHGTNQKFTIFSLEKVGSNVDYGMWGSGFYFSPIKSFSKGYGDILMKVFLNVRNPFVRNPNLTGSKTQFKPVYGKEQSIQLRNDILNANFDGVIQYESGTKNLITQIIAFHPEQIKLADGTNTTFDGSNPDIRFAKGGEVKKDFLKVVIKNVTKSNKYKGAYKQIFDTIEKDIVFYTPYGTESEDLIGNDFHITITPKPDQSIIEKISKIKNVVIVNDRYAEGGMISNVQQGDALIYKDSEFLDLDSVIYVEGVTENANGTLVSLSNGQRMFLPQVAEKFRIATPSEMNRSEIMGKELFSKGGNTKRTMKRIKRGGITYGKSHAEGGIPVKNQSTGDMLEVEGGEGIVNKRSMASKSKVTLNGKEMNICQAVSELNQMEGGVKFSCEDVNDRQFIKAMAKGGELDRGTRTEQEHIQVLKDLYAKRITPKEASERIAKDHLKEDSRYYSKLAKMEGKMADGGEVGFENTKKLIKEIEKYSNYQKGDVLTNSDGEKYRYDNWKLKYKSASNFLVKMFEKASKENTGKDYNTQFFYGDDYSFTYDRPEMKGKPNGTMGMRKLVLLNTKMADGGKTRKNAKKTLSEAVGFDINSIDISKL